MPAETLAQLIGLAMTLVGALWLGQVGAMARAHEVGEPDLIGALRPVAILLLLTIGATLAVWAGTS